jgi:polyisoprenyl-phosphate glycosyltransferase
MMLEPRYSLVIPVYKNQDSLVELLDVCAHLSSALGGMLEVVFVIDGSPDRCYEILKDRLPEASFPSQLVLHSRNFGSFAAIRTGIGVARGEFFVAMAADLQEPPELVIQCFQALSEKPVDFVAGVREDRVDPFFSQMASKVFWWSYRRFVNSEIPEGGVDVVGGNKAFAEALLRLEERNSSLVGQAFWLGFRRLFVPYTRRERRHGKSAWTFKRKVRYFMDSVFSFTDLPIRVMLGVGTMGLIVAIVWGTVTFLSRLIGLVSIKGYTATMISILFFSSLNIFSIGIIGAYLWRTYENTKKRPDALILFQHLYDTSVD